MVDRIVPATAAADLTRTARLLGLEDRGAVVTETFSQWVIEDRFVGPRPKWQAGGAQFVRDVRPFETAKLRMLNGAHSALAYVGLGLALEYVHEAMADPDLNALVRQLMKEAAATLTLAADQDLAAYAESLQRRFDNPSLPYRLIQIAMDGTQKIPQRWLASIERLRQQGAPAVALSFALAAWIAFVCTPDRELNDPLAGRLVDIRNRAKDAYSAADAILGEGGLLTVPWHADSAVMQRIQAQVVAIDQHGMRQALRRALTNSTSSHP